MKATQTEAPMEDSIHYRMCTQSQLFGLQLGVRQPCIQQQPRLYLGDPPLEYWQELAEQRRTALAETLQENEQVCV